MRTRHRAMMWLTAWVVCLPAACTPPDPPASELDVPIPAEPDDQAHVPIGTRVTYQHNPPASGPHWSGGTLNPFTLAPAPAGFYPNATAAEVLPEQWVHNLEHGYVVILYDCPDACDPQLLADLEALLDQVPPSRFGNVKLLITPYSGLAHPITAVAWHVQMYLDAFDAQALIDFYNRHVDRGPEDVP